MSLQINPEFTPVKTSKGKAIRVYYRSATFQPIGLYQIDLREIMRRSGMSRIETLDVFIYSSLNGYSEVFTDKTSGFQRYIAKGYQTVCPFLSSGVIEFTSEGFNEIQFVVYDHELPCYVSPFIPNLTV